jgi:hypothetical protein
MKHHQEVSLFEQQYELGYKADEARKITNLHLAASYSAENRIQPCTT